VSDATDILSMDDEAVIDAIFISPVISIYAFLNNAPRGIIL
jgi:hypothetical protein